MSTTLSFFFTIRTFFFLVSISIFSMNIKVGAYKIYWDNKLSFNEIVRLRYIAHIYYLLSVNCDVQKVIITRATISYRDELYEKYEQLERDETERRWMKRCFYFHPENQQLNIKFHYAFTFIHWNCLMESTSILISVNFN